MKEINNQPLVSVLMTVYNRERFVKEAIVSVIASTYQNWELIIVDDQSTDNSVEIARLYQSEDHRIKVYVNEKNLGDYPNRNKAASYANGKYIKYLDSDDCIYPHGLAVMVYSMEQFPNAGFGLSSQNFANKLFPLVTEPKETYIENFGGYSHFNRAPGSSIIKFEAFNDLGGFSGKRMIGDYEFWFKISAKYPMVKFQRDLIWDRTHTEQESKSEYARQYNILRKEVVLNALYSDSCPLDEKEIKHILREKKFKEIKQKIKSILYV